MIFNFSPSSTARYLSKLLQYDPRLLEDPSLQQGTQLLADYSAHLFVSDDNFHSVPELMETLLGLSPAVLNVKAEIVVLQGKKRTLENENKRLEEELTDLERQAKHPMFASHRDKGNSPEASEVSLQGSTSLSGRFTPTYAVHDSWNQVSYFSNT